MSLYVHRDQKDYTVTSDPRTSTSTFTQLLSSDNSVVVVVEVLLYRSTETVGLLGTGAQDVHLDFHTAPVGSDNSVTLYSQPSQGGEGEVRWGRGVGGLAVVTNQPLNRIQLTRSFDRFIPWPYPVMLDNNAA